MSILFGGSQVGSPVKPTCPGLRSSKKRNSSLVHLHILKLASCQWGPVTAHGVGILTKMYELALTNRLTNGFVGNIYG